MVCSGVEATAGAAVTLLLALAVIPGAFTEERMERTEVEMELEDSAAVRGGGVPGGVVLMASRLDRIALSGFISGFATMDGLGRPVSSSRNVFERFSSFSRGAPGRFLSFWQINNPRRRLGRAGSSPARKRKSFTLPSQRYVLDV